MAPVSNTTGGKKSSPPAAAPVIRPATPVTRPATPIGASATTEAKRKASQSPPAGRAASPRPPRPAAPDRINNLRISVMEKGEEIPMVDGKNKRYDLIEEIVRKALRVLESPGGNDSLAKMADALLAGWATEGKPSTWGSRLRTLPVLKTEMAAFVQRLRNSFPEISIRPHKALDAATDRFFPIGDADVVDFAVFDMDRLTLIFPSDLIANLMKAVETNVSTCVLYHKFNMIITICHEIIHMLVSALSGERRPETPPDMEVEGHDDAESGWWWEIEYLGGIVKMYQDKTNVEAKVLGTRQSGLPLLATGNSDKSTFRKIDSAYIAKLVQGSYCKFFHLPQPATDSTQNLGTRCSLLLTKLVNAAATSFDPFPITCTGDSAMPSDLVEKTYGKHISFARTRARVIKNPSLNNSPERRGSKASKIEASASSGTRARTSDLAAAEKSKATIATIPIRPKVI